MSDRRPRIIYAAKKAGRIIYIGQTLDLRARVANHKCTAPWCSDGVFFVELAKVWGRDVADDVEREFIAEHMPPENTQHTGTFREFAQLRPSDELCSVAEAADITEMSVSSVHKRIRLGQLTPVGKVGKSFALRRSDVERLATQTRRAA